MRPAHTTSAGSLFSASPSFGRSYRGAEEKRTTMDDATPGRDRGKMAAAVSNAILKIHSEHYGRGASRARTVMGADYVICFLEDIYTPVEKTLIEAGPVPAGKGNRSAVHDTI